MASKSFITELEELALLAIINLGDDAYGVPIAEKIFEVKNRRVSTGALYATLDRLEGMNLVTSWLGEKTAERGGRAKRYFAITPSGLEAVKELERVRRQLVPQLVTA